MLTCVDIFENAIYVETGLFIFVQGLSKQYDTLGRTIYVRTINGLTHCSKYSQICLV